MRLATMLKLYIDGPDGISQKTLAKQIGIAEPVLSRFLTGKTHPDAQAFAAIFTWCAGAPPQPVPSMEVLLRRVEKNIRNSAAKGKKAGYWCVICEKFLPSNDGVVVHDNVPHPETMTFDEDERKQ